MILRQRHFIDSHKGATGVFVLLLILGFGAQARVDAWIYLAMHGTYGLLWVLKSRIFGDSQWEQETSIGYGLTIWGGLSLYWVAPYLLVSGRVPPAPPAYLGLCVAIFALGVFFHFSADMQKHTQLRLRPGVLITDGLFALSRNPNYFGELLIYLSFVLLPRHPVPPLVLLLFIGAVWWPNMRRKDRSLSRYPAFADYRARTRLFIPYVL